MALDEATDPAYNPFDPASTGKFEAEPIVDFAQLALDMQAKARRRLVSAEDDYPLIWRVSRRTVRGDQPDTASEENDSDGE